MEEENIIKTFKAIYCNEKGDIYVTNRFFVFITEKKRKENGRSDNPILTNENVDLQLCVLSWKRTEKSKKKKKIRFTFARTIIQENSCYHDYNNTNSYVFDFDDDDDDGYNNLGDIISTLNKENVDKHTHFFFNLFLLKDIYAISLEKEQEDDEEKKPTENDTLTNTDDTPVDTPTGFNNQLENIEGALFSKLDELKGRTTRVKKRISLEYENKEESESAEDSSEEEEENEEESREENEENIEAINDSLLNKALNEDSDFLNVYNVTMENDIMSKKEFIELHQNYLEKYKNEDVEENAFILKEPVYISEEQKKSKLVDLNKEIKVVILKENKELKKLYDYYMENNIISENQFWYFLYNNKYSHLFFTDKSDRRSFLSNENYLNAKINLENSLSFSLENCNQDIKGTLEKCILKEYITTKCYDKKNPLFKNNYFLPEETPEGYGLMTNEKLLNTNINSKYLLINKFNNYSINLIKDKSLTFETYTEELKEKAEDPVLRGDSKSNECRIPLERTSLPKCAETDSVEQMKNKKYIDLHFEKFIDELQKGKTVTTKNYSDVFQIGRQLFVMNTKKCQSNQSLLIGTIEYESSILDIVKQYHLKINYLMHLFYTYCIPEQAKRSKILESLFKIRDEIQAKQEEYNSVLIMGKPLLIYLFEQISICKKFNDKLDTYIDRKRKRK